MVTDPRDLTHDPADIPDRRCALREGGGHDRGAPRRALPAAPAEGDTIWMGGIDRNGLAVSYIQSVYWAFGSGCVLPATGILWHNRGLSFSLDPAKAQSPGAGPQALPHPQPGASPSSMTDGCSPTAPWAARGSRRSSGQIFTRYADFGMGLADAVDAPRWLFGQADGLRDPEGGGSVRSRPPAGAAGFGHPVEELGKPYADASAMRACW